MRLLPPVTEPRVRRPPVAAMKSSIAPAAAPTAVAARHGGDITVDRNRIEAVLIKPAARGPARGGIRKQHHPVLGHEHVVEDESLASGAGQADDVPGVVDHVIARRHQQERRLARTLRRRGQPRRADRPLGIVATAGERPAAVQAITAGCCRGLADRERTIRRAWLRGCCPTRRAELPPGTARPAIGAPRAGRTPRRWRRMRRPCPSSGRRGPQSPVRSRRTRPVAPA